MSETTPGEKTLYIEHIPDLAREVLDALELPADVPEARFEQSRIEATLAAWLGRDDD